ncbi:MAG: AMP-binding protein [Eubacterium aggregans]|uniref:DVU_1553 family AMP-dependent CoA ligase n=1 Tax=Eubacterium aggregans TaxID=81409 RepID=UPI002B21FD5B|nr:AMP-binding protein [Eubacterium aggregans]MEA5074125.1 AMP-binding protein [Eubacterium aggregans]
MSGTLSRVDRLLQEKWGVQPLDRSIIQSYQLEALNQRLHQYHGAGIPGYPQQINGLEALSDLPIMDPAKLAVLTPSVLGISQRWVAKISILKTSGTTGPSKRLFFSRGDLEETRHFFQAGMQEVIGPGDVVLIAMPGVREESLAGLICGALFTFGARGIVLPANLCIDAACRYGASHGVTKAIAAPNFLLGLLRYAKSRRIPLAINGAILSSDHCHPVVVQGLQEEHGCRCFNHYAMMETGCAGAVECGSHQGMHIWEGGLLLEVVDPCTLNPLPDGVQGELLITTLVRQIQPLLRYRTGDLGRMTHHPCSCGGATARLWDVIRAEGQCTFGKWNGILFGDAQVVDYEVTQKNGELKIKIITIAGWIEKSTADALREVAPGAAITLYSIQGNDRLIGGKQRVTDEKALAASLK